RGEAAGCVSHAVGSVVMDLIRSGVVKDVGAGPSRGGRRPSFMEFNARHGFVAGIHLGPRPTRVSMAELRGELRAHHVLPTPPIDDPAALLDQIATALRALMHDQGIPPG